MTKHEKKVINGLLRQLIGIRDKERCLKCGTTEQLQMSHIYPKGTHRRMEFDPDNIKLLCFRDHFHWWHKHPLEAAVWLENTLPKTRLDRLKLLAATTAKNTLDYKLHKLWLEQEIKKTCD